MTHEFGLVDCSMSRFVFETTKDDNVWLESLGGNLEHVQNYMQYEWFVYVRRDIMRSSSSVSSCLVVLIWL